MKFWLLTSEYPPFYGGGISTYCLFTAKMLAEKGHDVTVFVNNAHITDVSVDEIKGVRVIQFNPAFVKSDAYLGHVANISYAFAHVVKQFIEKEGKPDIIEAQEYLGIAYYLLQYKYLGYDWCSSITVLITMHSPAFIYLPYNQVSIHRYPNYWISEMERFCLQAADIIISPSQFLVKEIKSHFDFRNKNLYVVPNPFEVKNLQQIAVDASQQQEIVFFGKLSAQKGTFKLLQYFQQLWNEGFQKPLHMIGAQDIIYHPEGKMMGDLVSKKYKKYIDKGLLLLEKKLPPSAISQRLLKAKVVIVPSIVDNLPYVVMEMMALGLIVLVSKQGGQAEMVENGVSGFIFDHNDPSTFFSQLHKILNLNKEERKAIAANAQAAAVSNYAFDKIYEQKINILKDFINVKREFKHFPFVENEVPQVDEEVAEENKLLSIIIPYYNMGKYIDETIKSLEEVDYSNTEFLIVNDGSNDPASIEKLERYRSLPQFKVIDTINGGLAQARNTGAANAAGAYMAFLDADDKVAPAYYSKAIKVLSQYENVHFVGCWTQYFEGSQKVWPTFTPEPPLILFHNTVNSSSLVYKTKSFLAAGQNDGAMPFQGLEDYDSVISMVTNGYKGVVLPEILFHYRVRGDSMIRGISVAKKLLLYEYISKKYKYKYATFATEILGLVNANGAGIVLDNPSLDYALADHMPFGNKFSKHIISLIKRNAYTKMVAYRIYRLIN